MANSPWVVRGGRTHAPHTDGQVSRQQQALVQRVERQEKELVILRHEAATAMVGGGGGAAAEETRYVGRVVRLPFSLRP